jgi:hypothetical protein
MTTWKIESKSSGEALIVSGHRLPLLRVALRCVEETPKVERRQHERKGNF